MGPPSFDSSAALGSLRSSINQVLLGKEQQLKHQDLLDKQNSKRSNRVKKKTPASQKVSSLLIGVMGIVFACG